MKREFGVKRSHKGESNLLAVSVVQWPGSLVWIFAGDNPSVRETDDPALVGSNDPYGSRLIIHATNLASRSQRTVEPLLPPREIANSLPVLRIVGRGGRDRI
jgi:hypothetical protein